MKITQDTKNLDFLHSLFYLRLYYKKLLEILEVFCGKGSHAAFRNETLNGVYTLLKSYVEEILAKDDFKKLAKDAPQLFESLIGDIEEANIEWEFLSKEAYAFLGKIEKEYILSESPHFDAPDWEELSKQIDEVITVHRTHQKQSFDRLMETARKYRPFFEPQEDKTKTFKKPIALKDVSLDENNHLLEINHGEKIISFKSKKSGEGLEKETKQFKILYHLWDFKWELKDGKVLIKGDIASLDNLARVSGSESPKAAYKHIQRLNNRFKKEGVAIEIKGENEKYRLIINRA